MHTLLVGWPTRSDNWRNFGLDAQRAMVHFVHAIIFHTRTLRVCIVADEDDAKCGSIINMLTAEDVEIGDRLQVLQIPMNDCWIRDTGPIFVLDGNGNIRGECFKFNAWGGPVEGCYSDFARDGKVAARLCNQFNVEAVKHDIVFEGGSVSSDRHGTLLTTEECLLNKNRNPKMSKPEIEIVLRRALSARKIIWIPYGAAGDYDTDGHVDNMAIFARRGHVLLLDARESEFPEQHRRTHAALSVLHGETDADGNEITLHRVFAPPPQRRTKVEADTITKMPSRWAIGRNEGDLLCASYVNVVVAENVVFAPSFRCPPADEAAMKSVKTAFGGKKVVLVDAREFVLGGGGMHCLSLEVQ